jgi:hypothetical protein
VRPDGDAKIERRLADFAPPPEPRLPTSATLRQRKSVNVAARSLFSPSCAAAGGTRRGQAAKQLERRAATGIRAPTRTRARLVRRRRPQNGSRTSRGSCRRHLNRADFERRQRSRPQDAGRSARVKKEVGKESVIGFGDMGSAAL